jgi:O-antigen/teichoic acid export membrane protein
MQERIKQLRDSQFVRHNTIFFIGAMSVGLLNYLTYPIIGRLLPAANFGEMQVLFSLFAQILIFLNVFGLLTVNIVANYEDPIKRNRVISELERLALAIGLIILVATIAGAVTLKHFFHFGSVWPFEVLAIAVLVSVPLAFRNSYLRGKKRFAQVSTLNFTAAAADLVFAVLFVLAGWRTTGAMLGLVAAQLIAFGFAAYLAKRDGFTESIHDSFFRLPDFKLLLPELKYAALVLCGSLAITLMYSVDTIAVKHYFDANTAGQYAGIATVGRIIFFLTGSIAAVLLPSIKMKAKPHDNRKVLWSSLGLTAVIGGGALLVFSLLPRFVVHVLMGSKYVPQANLLPRLGFVLFTISILNLFVLYHMALRHYAIILIVALGLSVTLILLTLHHQTLVSVIDSLLFGSAAMFLVLGAWLGIVKYKEVADAA